MEDLIQSLKYFAEKDFPVEDVSKYLNNYNLDKKYIEKYCHFSEARYSRNLVYKDESFEILFLCWAPGHIAPIHGHEGEKCWARVDLGQLKFCNYNLISKAPLELKFLDEIIGETGFLDGPADIHSVENVSDSKAVSLHVYAKPYDSCEVYDLDVNKIKRSYLTYYSKYGQICL